MSTKISASLRFAVQFRYRFTVCGARFAREMLIGEGIRPANLN